MLEMESSFCLVQFKSEVTTLVYCLNRSWGLYSRHGSTDNVLIGESVIIRMKSTFGLITKVFYLYCGMIVTGFEIKKIESWIMCSRRIVTRTLKKIFKKTTHFLRVA